MKRALLAGLLALAGCESAGERAPAGESAVVKDVPEVGVDELSALLAEQRGVAVDANNEPVRERQGVIPGATLLSHYRTFDVGELPADRGKPLVFYCANEHCGASHEAASRALAAGYTDVRVLPAGIAGWRAAGKPVQSL